MDWFRLARLKRFWFDYQDNIVLAIAIVALGTVLVQGRRQGVFQALELQIYDRMVRQQPQLPADDRLFLVEITEDDLRQQETWPFPDDVYAQVLENLQAGNPAVIALDVYRDFPVGLGYDRLVTQFQKPNFIAIRNLDILTGTPAPPAVSPEQVGFNDFTLDPDGVLRRAILYAAGSDGVTLPAFGLLSAMVYLGTVEGITPQSSEINPQFLQLGEATFVPLTPTSGAYQKMDAGGYQMLFHYRDRHTMEPKVTFTEVLTGDFDPSQLENKIVLIGSTAPSLKDEVVTPFTFGNLDGQRMGGVVAHGQIISYVLDTALGDRRQYHFWTGWQETLWYLSCIMVGAGVGWKLRHPLAITAAVLVGVGTILGTGYILLSQFIWIPVAAPLVGFVVAMGMVITYESYQGFRQQKMVMQLLGQNTSPEIANALWQERSELLSSGHLPGRSLTATMLFLDVRGFSTISEMMEPKDLLLWLNELLSMVTREVQQRNGIVNKFTGDGIIAIFGVPVPRESQGDIADDAEASVEAAVAIARNLTLVNQSYAEKKLPHIKLRIGIYTGGIVAGSLGGKDRMEYGIIGDSVNTASRLESCAKERQPVDCRILIARATSQYLGDRFALEPWGPMPLKGKSEVLELFRVITPEEDEFYDRKQAPSPPPRTGNPKDAAATADE